jgi:signal transduction histidine kinase
MVKFHPESKSFKVFDELDGLKFCKSIEFGYKAFYKATSGEIYSGGASSVAVFSPDSLKDNPSPPPIVLTDFKINYETVKIGPDSPLRKSITVTDNIKLAHHQDILSFEFAALDYTSPGKNLYAYKMEGINSDWVYTDASRRFAIYTNLDPGKYVFKVKASNNDGVWNEEGTAIKVIIIPPFWQRLWFQLAIGLLVLSGIIGLVRFLSTRKLRQQLDAVEQQRAMEKERTRISSDMHDEIGASLTHIAITSELLKKSLNQTQKNEVQNYVEDIARTAREVIDHIGEIIWAINPRNDSLDNLIAYIRQYAGNFFEALPIHCRYDLPEHLPPQTLTSEARRNLFLVTKEALHNILKHAEAKDVQIKIALHGDDLELSIADNGKGFCQQEVSRFGNGLKNMKKRMTDIGGKFEISSRQGEGTVIKIRLRLG